MKINVLKKIAITVLITSSLGFAACGTSNKVSNSNPDKILVGLDDSFPPMGFKSSSNELQGFDIDMAKEIEKKINKKFDFMPYNWDGIIPGLQSKKFDVVISAMSVTEERQKQINFTVPYIMEKQVIVTKGDSIINSPEDLKGKVVGVQLGSTSEHAMEPIKNTFKEVKEYKNNMDAINDLGIGRIDAVVIDELVARYYLKEQGNKFKVAEKELSKEPVAIGIRKEDSAMKDELDKAIQELKQDGTLAKISEKWFGEDITNSK